MIDERELKLECVKLANGELHQAERLYEWVSGKEDFERGFNDGLERKAQSGMSEAWWRGCNLGEEVRKLRAAIDRVSLSPASPVGLDSFSQGAGETSETVLPEAAERAEQNALAYASELEADQPELQTPPAGGWFNDPSPGTGQESRDLPQGFIPWSGGEWGGGDGAGPSGQESIQQGGMAEEAVPAIDRAIKSAVELGEMLGMKLHHDSDCPVNNAPAFEPGPCNCGAEPITDRVNKALGIVSALDTNVPEAEESVVVGQVHLHARGDGDYDIIDMRIPEGFIPWSGGEQPVAGWVEAILRDGSRSEWLAQDLYWMHDNSPDRNLVAYRVIAAPSSDSGTSAAQVATPVERTERNIYSPSHEKEPA